MVDSHPGAMSGPGESGHRSSVDRNHQSLCIGPWGHALDNRATEEVAGLSLLPKSIIDLWDKRKQKILLVNNKEESRRSQRGEQRNVFSLLRFFGCPWSHQPAVCQLRLPRDPSPIAPIPTCVPLQGQALVPVHPRFSVKRNRAQCRGNSCPL